LNVVFAEQAGTDDRADGAGVGCDGIVRADVGMAAEFAKNGTGVEARSASDAEERFFERGIAQARAAIVHEDDVALLAGTRRSWV
jgi:hypothetical protein